MTTAGKPSLAWNEAIAFKTAMWETANMNWSSLLVLLTVTAQLSHSGYPHVGREQKNHHLLQSLPKRYFGPGFLPWGNNLHLLVTSVEPWVKNKTAEGNKTSQRRICFRWSPSPPLQADTRSGEQEWADSEEQLWQPNSIIIVKKQREREMGVKKGQIEG